MPKQKNKETGGIAGATNTAEEENQYAKEAASSNEAATDELLGKDPKERNKIEADGSDSDNSSGGNSDDSSQ